MSHTKIVIIMLFLPLLTHSVEVTELEIKEELYTGNSLTEAESTRYSFIGVREEGDTIIIAAQKRNPYSLRGYNFTQCVLHTNKDKLCSYIDFSAGKQRINLFRLDQPDPKAFALMRLFISIQARRSDRSTRKLPHISSEAESCT